MAKDSFTNDNDFQKMLLWLDPEIDQAGEIYESIRLRLIKIFCARGCTVSEELADETIDRVTKKINDLQKDYEGDPKLYFYGVGRRVFLEHTRKPIQKELPATLTSINEDDDQSEIRDRCLSACLKNLEPDDKAFILRYYKGDKGEKIERRKRMKEEYGLSFENLRVKAYRIRVKLQKCVLKKFKLLDM